MAFDGSAAGAEDVLSAALNERPSEQQAPESKKRSRRATGPPAPKCSNCGRKPQRRCEHQLCAKCCAATGKQCSIHANAGLQQSKATSVRDLAQAHGIYQQEAEESRLWYQWIFEQSQTSACNDLGKALERYQFNNELLTTLMDGAGLAENQQDLLKTAGKLEEEVRTFVDAYSSIPEAKDEIDEDSRIETNLIVSDLDTSISHSTRQSGITPVKMSEIDFGVLEDILDNKNVIQL